MSELRNRCSHVSVLVDQKFIIFGGINQKGMLKSELMTFDLDKIRIDNFRSKGKQLIRKELTSTLSSKENIRTKF